MSQSGVTDTSTRRAAVQEEKPVLQMWQMRGKNEDTDFAFSVGTSDSLMFFLNIENFKQITLFTVAIRK